MSAPLARTPEPPYYAVIFTSRRTAEDDAGYARTADAMAKVAAEQPGHGLPQHDLPLGPLGPVRHCPTR